jgi:hypothetical protein
VTFSSCNFIHAIFSRLDKDIDELSRYAHFDASKNYTRNLVSTDDKHYTLLLLCWNPGKESPVHDHPCDGCWMQVFQGNVQESRYEQKGEKLECFYDAIYHGKFIYVKVAAIFYQALSSHLVLLLHSRGTTGLHY